ncbi:MAG: PEP-CTERM sorting domain-containing protein [Thermoguttaceae bacterium]|nr:PEP-CTERM sorting domain-containing protein [Thermoguttaceae bacterium]
MKLKANPYKSGFLTGFLSLLVVFSLVPVVSATEITADYAGGTITNGMIIKPTSNAITISGTTTISGSTGIASGSNTEYYTFFVYNGNPVTISSDAKINMASGSEIRFDHGSHTTIAGTVNLTSGSRVRLGVGGPAATLENPVEGTLTVTGTLNIKTSGDLWSANGGAGTPTAKEDAPYTYTMNVNGGNVTLQTSSSLGLGCRNNVNLNITNGGNILLKNTAGNTLLCGVQDTWGGHENKVLNLNVENGTLAFDVTKNIRVGAAAYQDFTRKVAVTIGANGTFETNRPIYISDGDKSQTTFSVALNGGTFYAKTNAITLPAGTFSISGDAKIKVDNSMTLGVVSGTGNLIKQGEGTLKLTERETYTGSTQVQEGRLILAAEHSTSLKSKNMSVSAGAVLELAKKNASDYGNYSPNMTLAAKTDTLPGGELNLSMTASPWTSVRQLTMGDGSKITIGTVLPTLYVCDVATVPANASAQIDALIGIRSVGENSSHKNAGKFNIGEGGTLTLTNGIFAWGNNNKTNTLIKQGAGEMIVQGRTYATANYPLRVQVDAGKLVLENVDTASNNSTFESVTVASGAELLLGGTLPATTTVTIAEGAKFGAIGTLTSNQGITIPSTWNILLDSSQENLTSTIKLSAGELTFAENVTPAIEMVNNTTLEGLISRGDVDLLNFSGDATYTLPSAAGGDWNYFIQYFPEDVQEYYSLGTYAGRDGSTTVGLILNRNMVPEPSTWILLLLGAAGLFRIRRKA